MLKDHITPIPFGLLETPPLYIMSSKSDDAADVQHFEGNEDLLRSAFSLELQDGEGNVLAYFTMDVTGGVPGHLHIEPAQP